MRENIFDYLKEYGFNKEDIYSFQNENDKLYFVDITLVTTNIKFLEDKGLSNKEVINVIKNNPYLLTIGSNKKNILDNIYNNLFNKEELKNLIINYPNTYIINPLELEKIITYLSNNGYIKENIKELFLSNPNIINMNFNYFLKIIKQENN